MPSGSLQDEQVLPIRRQITTEPRFSDRVFRLVVTAGGFTSLIVLGMITAFLAYRGFEVFRTFGFHFITSFTWDGGNPDAGVKPSFGIGAMLIGTVVISLVALTIALPVAVGSALFLTHYAPMWLRKPLTILVDLMAAIPSVVYGLWGFFVLMPHAIYWAKLLNKYLGWIPIFKVPLPIFERSPFIAGLVLAVMIIPIITAISREVFTQVPLDRIQAAYALGATRWSMIRAVVLPFGSSGIAGGAMLGLGRAMGETVAVYLALNLAYKANFHIHFSSGGSIASMIVNKFGEASPFELKGLMAAGLALFVMTLIVNFLANLIVRRASRTGR
ncbi:phosphate transport system permease protein PstC [mine drainage metagenome]|uniref:Phosphate transport system permease protein PstC n=1 Tax=mine drainage metagenome TaxID=410659 RepID=A0A1J5PQ84_9ZZZZ